MATKKETMLQLLRGGPQSVSDLDRSGVREPLSQILSELRREGHEILLTSSSIRPNDSQGPKRVLYHLIEAFD